MPSEEQLDRLLASTDDSDTAVREVLLSAAEEQEAAEVEHGGCPLAEVSQPVGATEVEGDGRDQREIGVDGVLSFLIPCGRSLQLWLPLVVALSIAQFHNGEPIFIAL